MTTLPKTLRALAAGLLALVLALTVLLFAASRIAERSMRSERRFGDLHLRVHGPSVSPFFRIRADSLILWGPTFRLAVVEPDARLFTRGALPFRHDGAAAVILRGDSLFLDLDFHHNRTSKPVKLPATLRFPFGIAVEWRVLTVHAPGMATITAGPAYWRTRGSQVLRGEFDLRTPMEDLPRLNAGITARWRGPALRYQLDVTEPGGAATLRVSGIRGKNDLRRGYDSVEFFAARPSRSLPHPGGLNLSAIADLKLAGKVDWRQDSLRFQGRFTTLAHPPLQKADWSLSVRMGSRGGRFNLGADGPTQSVHANGWWMHPVSWPAFPALTSWRGQFTARVRGGDWKIHPFTVPLDFEIPDARLDTGMRLSAEVLTRDASRIEVSWNGRQPGRLEFDGDVSPTEGFALNWTDTNVSYRSAHVSGTWEDSRLLALARVCEPRAYGAFADSLEAENEVTSHGYFLRAGRIYRGGETFTGEGEVLWKNPAGKNEVSLRFNAGNPVDGHASIVMDPHGAIEITADSLYPTRFPHRVAERFLPLDPLLQGHLNWNHLTSSGSTSLGMRLTGAHGVLDAHADATWTKDSLRVRQASVRSGEAVAEAEGVLPFDGHALAGPWDARRMMGGRWRVRAVEVDPEVMLDFVGRSKGKFRGVVNGELLYSVPSGLAGQMRADSLRLPAGPGGLGISGVTVMGIGDSLRADIGLFGGLHTPWRDTAVAVLSGLGSSSPHLHAEARSLNGFAARIEGWIPGWSRLDAHVEALGRVALGENLGSLEAVRLEGELFAPLSAAFARSLVLKGRAFSLLQITARDTQVVNGVPTYAEGLLKVSEINVHGGRGGDLSGFATLDVPRRAMYTELSGSRVNLVLPGGESLRAQELTTVLSWDPERGLVANVDARGGFAAFPPSSLRIETGFEQIHARVTYPPPSSPEVAPTLTAKARLHDLLLERKWGWRDATDYFTGFNRSARSGGTAKRSRPWELDVELEAAGVRNRVNTDILRMNFTGDARITGAYPYTLVRGKVSGLQGEVGQVRQAYVLRDFEVNWDNVTLEDGTLSAEGEKRLRTDCRPDTRQTCQISIHLDGRLEDVRFTYDTDCGQNSGQAVVPSVLINSMVQGCYVSETPGGEGNYGSAAVAMLEPTLNARLSRGVSKGSGGFIKSTQVSGLSALIGSDSSGLEAVSLEVESREVHRVGLKGRAGYHPETKLANPMEYRMAAEYRPPLDRLATDSLWRARLRNRFTVEAAVETRPEGRDVEEARRVRQRAGLRYRYRFWDLW